MSNQSATLALEVLDSDHLLVSSWLHGRSQKTIRAYAADAARLLRFVDKSLAQVTLADLQAFADSLADLKPSSAARTLSAVKSLLSFAQKTGYLPLNVGAALKLPKIKNELAERILSESAVHKLLAMETNPRNHALLRLLYGAGLRRAEVCGLRWRDLQESHTLDGHPTGQVAIFGKGGKTRFVLLTPDTWAEVSALRGDAASEAPVFPSRLRGRALSEAQVNNIVRQAAERAGITAPVSPHWLRHAHASHALDRKAPIHLVQATLGHASVATTGRYLHARPSDSSAQYLTV